MDTQWSFLNNPFDAATHDSFRAARKIGDYTINALQPRISDPFFAGIYSTLLPFRNAYNTAYDTWIGQMGTQKSKTSGLTATFKELSGLKIRQWDVAIQNVYEEGTEGYINLLPQHRKPFQQGPQEARISALSALNTKVSADAGLPASLKADIAAVLLDINNHFGSQQGAISITRSASETLEVKRVAMCQSLYGALGLLMNVYQANPAQIAPFFDLETIRNHEQSVFRNGVAKDSRRLIMTHTFAEGEDLKLINDGDVALRFFLAVNENDPMPDTAIAVAPGDNMIVDVSELGDISSRYLIAVNESAVADGHYTVVLI